MPDGDRGDGAEGEQSGSGGGRVSWWERRRQSERAGESAGEEEEEEEEEEEGAVDFQTPYIGACQNMYVCMCVCVCVCVCVYVWYVSDGEGASIGACQYFSHADFLAGDDDVTSTDAQQRGENLFLSLYI